MKRILPFAVLLAACAKDHPSDRPVVVRIPDQAKKNVPEQIRTALTDGDVVELLSLYPYPRGYDEKLWKARGYDKLDKADDYAILGRTELTGDARARALNALYHGVADSDGTVAACFNPRHGFRVQHGGAVYEVVICYECLSMTFRRDGQRLGSTTTTKAPGRVLTALLKRAGVALPDK